MLKELRRCTYGILLFEKPLEPGKTDNYVSELVMTGFDSMENFELVKPKYLEKGKFINYCVIFILMSFEHTFMPYLLFTLLLQKFLKIILDISSIQDQINYTLIVTI